MEQINPESRVQLKEKLLKLLRAAPASSFLLASATLSIPSADASISRLEPRPSIEQRVSTLRDQAEQLRTSTAPESKDTLLAWGNWTNWGNGWPNGWHNWHNWHKWWH
jgi:hypothetical protein